MTTVKINDKPRAREIRIRDIGTGELFRYTNDNKIYLMTDEFDDDGYSLALLITNASSFGTLVPFENEDKVTKLNGTITVEID